MIGGFRSEVVSVFYLLIVISEFGASVAKCRGSWVVGRGRGSWVWVNELQKKNDKKIVIINRKKL